MKKAWTRFSVLIILISSVLACALRFVQLLKFTNSSTGYVVSESEWSYAVYALLIVALIGCALYSYFKNNLPSVVYKDDNKAVFFVSVFLSITFFYDFIHQCFNCFKEVSKASFIEYNYVIPMGLSGVLALVGSFYFFILAKTMTQDNYDFRNFTFLHFVPVLWAFLKMIMLMSRIVDVREGIESVCEFLFLAWAMCFFFCFITAVDSKEKPATKMFVFSALMTSVTAFAAALPRLLMIVSANGEKAPASVFSSITYAAVGIFALTLLKDINNRCEEY